MSTEVKVDLAAENERLKAELALLQARIHTQERDNSVCLINSKPSKPQTNDGDVLSIVVLGASGDLACKKTYPALFSLFVHKLLPDKLIIAGYARSAMKDEDFKKKIKAKFDKKYIGVADEFLSKCFYHAGQYDSTDDFKKLDTVLQEKEQKAGAKKGANRIFYMAIPPDVFVATGRSVAHGAMSKTGWNRVIVEKPFGRDSETSAELIKALDSLFYEDQLYRIDHYLGKEMVQNLMVLRFANTVFEPIWNRDHVQCVIITFKEDFGTQGRGGYFDHYGIIRDVMQNHLLQVLSLVGMEPPSSMNAEDVRDEKVKLLRAIKPLTLDDIVFGQYGADPHGSEPSYLDDPGVPKDSVTPTFACAALTVNNPRWAGVPFILKCGKALNERKAEIRIQFKVPHNQLFSDISPNELVLRIQPDEAVYFKMTTKQPGLEGGCKHTELNLSYKQRFGEEAAALPDAYERLILDVVRGDHNLFVRADELVAAWKIFTPVLHEIEQNKIKPEIYPYGGRGPESADELIAKHGYIRTLKYEWEPEEPRSAL